MIRPTKGYLRLDPTCAMVIKPDTNMLRFCLLERWEVAHDNQHAPRLQHKHSQLCRYSLRFDVFLNFLNGDLLGDFLRRGFFLFWLIMELPWFGSYSAGCS